jgi:Family of unknown function (DUF6152)
MKARRASLLFLLIGSLLFVSVPLLAHHGTFVSYDTKHPVTMTGVVAEYHFTNPHTQLYFDVTDDKGNVTRWAAEGPAPEIWVEAGWGKKRTEATLAPGTKITITLSPARNGKPVGAAAKIFLANGEQVGPAGAGEPPNQ